MPRGDREKQKKAALIMYKKGTKLVDIAKELGVPAGTVRRWKSENEWDSERSVKKTNVRKGKTEENIKEEAFLKEDEAKTATKRELFCLYYVKYRNQVKAYQMAYKCSYETACSNASTLVKNSEIKDRINELLSELRENIDFSIKDIAQKQIDIANADIKDFVKIQDGVVLMKDLEQIDGTLIKEIKNTKSGVQLKLKDSQKAMEWLSKHQDMVTPKRAEEMNRIILTKRKEPPDDYMGTTV